MKYQKKIYTKLKWVIKGDVKYGAKRANKDKSICLHAKNIEFIHPITKAKISLDANPPKSNIWSN